MWPRSFNFIKLALMTVVILKPIITFFQKPLSLWGEPLKKMAISIIVLLAFEICGMLMSNTVLQQDDVLCTSASIHQEHHSFHQGVLSIFCSGKESICAD